MTDSDMASSPVPRSPLTLEGEEGSKVVFDRLMVVLSSSTRSKLCLIPSDLGKYDCSIEMKVCDGFKCFV